MKRIVHGSTTFAWCFFIGLHGRWLNVNDGAVLALVSHVVVVVRKSSCVSQVKRFVAVLRRSAGTIFSFDAVQVCHDGMDETVFGVFDIVVAHHAISLVYGFDAHG